MDFLTVLLPISLIACLFLLKNERTFKLHYDIITAICEYHIECIKNDITPEVEYEDTETYNKTFLRFWDWSNKHILPSEKMELIKPYFSNTNTQVTEESANIV